MFFGGMKKNLFCCQITGGFCWTCSTWETPGWKSCVSKPIIFTSSSGSPPFKFEFKLIASHWRHHLHDGSIASSKLGNPRFEARRLKDRKQLAIIFLSEVSKLDWITHIALVSTDQWLTKLWNKHMFGIVATLEGPQIVNQTINLIRRPTGVN